MVEIKDLIRHKLARGECCTLAECKRFVSVIVAASEAQAEEDFHLLTSLTDQVAAVGAEDLLPALTVGAPTCNVDTREVIESILIAQERDPEASHHQQTPGALLAAGAAATTTAGAAGAAGDLHNAPGAAGVANGGGGGGGGDHDPMGGVNTGVAAERVRRKANQRVVDLIDIVAVCRAERIKLLAELVTASRNRDRPKHLQ